MQMRFGVGAIVVIAVVIGAGITACDDKSAENNGGMQGQPSDEAAFIAAKVAVESSYNDAPNDIVKSQIYDQWRGKEGSCSVLKTATITNWTGAVTGILSDGGLIVSIGNGISVESTVDNASPVFKVISTLREGAAVKFSGAFDSGDPNCIAEVIALPWGDGAIKSPDFKVHFSDVEPL